MGDWAVTERFAGTITLAEGVTVRGDLHLQQRVAHRSGRETPLELFNRPEPFYPVTLPGGETVFIARAQTLLVVCDLEFGLVDPERTGAAKRIGLEVVLHGGVEVRGWASMEMPPTRTRALDFLNAGTGFFSLRDDDHTYLVNRAHARLVRPLG